MVPARRGPAASAPGARCRPTDAPALPCRTCAGQPRPATRADRRQGRARQAVEAGLIAQRILLARPEVPVLYLAPARGRNVVTEFRRLGVDARRWVAGGDSDARVEGDRVVVASIQKAVRVGDERRHARRRRPVGPADRRRAPSLFDREPGGGNPNAGYRPASPTYCNASAPRPDTSCCSERTPHQGHQARFENILGLLRQGDEGMDEVAGRVIFRTKESFRDWNGRPPRRAATFGCRRRTPGGPWSSGTSRSAPEMTARRPPVSQARGGGPLVGQGPGAESVASSTDAGSATLRDWSSGGSWDPTNPALAEALDVLRRTGRGVDEPLASLMRVWSSKGGFKDQGGRRGNR